MKKIITTIVLTVVFSLTVLADGDSPVGGRSCQPPAACFTAPVSTEKSVRKDDAVEGILTIVKNWLSVFFA